LNLNRLMCTFHDLWDFMVMASFAVDDHFLPSLSCISCCDGALCSHGYYKQAFRTFDDALDRKFQVITSIFIEDKREIPWAVKILLNIWWELVFKVPCVWLRCLSQLRDFPPPKVPSTAATPVNAVLLATNIVELRSAIATCSH
jgi:hypothetical protein